MGGRKGFIKCSECGSNLYRLTRIKKDMEQVYYYCGTYLRTKKCNKHYILEKELDNSVITILNKYIEFICDVNNKIEDIVSVSKIEYNYEIKKIKILEINKEIEKYKTLLNEVCKDYKCDYITKEDFENYKRTYLYEVNRLRLEKEELEKSKLTFNNLKWINTFKKIGKFELIDRNIVDEFVENIYVNDDRSIKINFKYQEQYEDAIKSLQKRNSMI